MHEYPYLFRLSATITMGIVMWPYHHHTIINNCTNIDTTATALSDLKIAADTCTATHVHEVFGAS
jgi:hypothetical protein